MNTVKKCPNCGGMMEADTKNGLYRCPNCATEIPFDESDSVKKERILANALTDIAETEAKMSENIEKEKTRRLDKKHRTVIILIGLFSIFLVGFFIVRALGGVFDGISHRNDVKITDELLNYSDLDYETVKSKYEFAGFTNIDVEAVEDLGPLLTEKQGLVKSVSINDDKAFSKGAWFHSDSKVFIQYHMISSSPLGGVQPLHNSDHYINLEYQAALSDFLEAGFSNVQINPLKDLDTSSAKKANIIESITINGNPSFNYYTVYSDTATVAINYHSVKPKKITVTSSAKDYKGKEYHAVISELKDAGFTNLQYVFNTDVSLFHKKNTIHSVSINGSSSFEKGASFSEDAPVSISIYIDEKGKSAMELELYPNSGKGLLPLSSNEMKGKDYKVVVQQLEDAGFTNITTIPNPDVPRKKPLFGGHKDGEIQSATLQGNTKFDKKTLYPKDSVIRITYHTYAEEETNTDTNEPGEGQISLSCSAKDLKSKNYEEVISLFKEMGFVNIETETVEDAKKSIIPFLSKKENTVEKVTINEDEKFKKGDLYDQNAKVIITYHVKKES